MKDIIGAGTSVKRFFGGREYILRGGREGRRRGGARGEKTGRQQPAAVGEGSVTLKIDRCEGAYSQRSVKRGCGVSPHDKGRPMNG